MSLTLDTHQTCSRVRRNASERSPARRFTRVLANAATCLTILLCLAAAQTLVAQQSFTSVARDVNRKMVKLFGAGGFKGLPSYGTGVLISPKGHILTVNNHILATSDLRVHLYDGRAHHAKVVGREPDLDLAILKIEDDIDFLPHYDLEEAVQRPLAEPGDWILAMSNAFQI